MRYISNTTVEIFASLKPTSYHHRLTVICYTSGTHTEPRFILIAKMSTISEQRHGWSSYSYTQKVNLTTYTHPPHGHLRAAWQKTIAIWIAGIMFYKLGLETFQGSITYEFLVVLMRNTSDSNLESWRWKNGVMKNTRNMVFSEGWICYFRFDY